MEKRFSVFKDFTGNAIFDVVKNTGFPDSNFGVRRTTGTTDAIVLFCPRACTQHVQRKSVTGSTCRKLRRANSPEPIAIVNVIAIAPKFSQ